MIQVWLWLQYAEKLFVRKPRENQYPPMVAQQIWEGVRTNDKKAVYRLIVNQDADANTVYEQVCLNSSLTLAKVMLLQEQAGLEHCSASNSMDRSSTSSLSLAGNSEAHILEDLDGCSLLHLACETADIGMLELLLQYGANINAIDARGQTPLHHCILKGKATFAKLLLARWFLLLLLAVTYYFIYFLNICSCLSKEWMHLQGSWSAGCRWGR